MRRKFYKCKEMFIFITKSYKYKESNKVPNGVPYFTVVSLLSGAQRKEHMYFGKRNMKTIMNVILEKPALQFLGRI